MKPIGKDFELIKTIRKSKNKNIRDGIAYVEQVGVIEKLLSSKMLDRFIIKAVIVCEELINTDYAKNILKELMIIASDVYSVSIKTYELIVEKKNNAGILAVVDFNEYNLSEFEKQNFKNIVVIDGLENPGNVGTIFRSADACGIDAIMCVDLKTMVYGNKCIASSRGMIFEIPSVNLSYDEAKEFFAKNNYSLYLSEPQDGTSFDKIKYADKKAMVVGSERFGINQDWFNLPHHKIYIPMVGSMTSLNVSIAASLIMYQAMNGKS